MVIEIEGRRYNFKHVIKWEFIEDGRYDSDKNWELHLLFSKGENVTINLTENSYKNLRGFLDVNLKVKSFTKFVKVQVD